MRRLPIALLATLPLLPALAAPALADSPSARAEAIDRIMSRYYRPGEPGAAVIVVDGGKTIFRKGYGIANLEHGIPVTPETVFAIGSMTKQVTAVATLLLVEDGKLSLGDPIGKYLPAYATHRDSITVEHLLTHTSGIPDYTREQEFYQHACDEVTLEAVVDSFEDRELLFEPGERWSYSNSGYVLLGAIVEAVSGTTYEEFLRQRIFEVAGMTSTQIGDASRIIEGRATGYQAGDDGWVNARLPSMSQYSSAGAIWSTVDDLARWNAALVEGRIIDREMLERAWSRYELDDGSFTSYGYGWGVGEWQADRVIEHNGGMAGFRSDGVWIPDHGLYVALLTNASGTIPEPYFVARKVATEALGQPWEPQAVALGAETLSRYPGVYRTDANTPMVVRLDGDRLFTQWAGGEKVRAIPRSETELFYEGSFRHLSMEIDAAGEVRSMTIHDFGTDPVVARRTSEELPEREVVRLDPAILDRYVGRYELMPGFIVTIRRKGTELWSQATGQQEALIHPQSETLFFHDLVEAELEFQLDAAGRVTGFVFRQGGQEMAATRLPD